MKRFIILIISLVFVITTNAQETTKSKFKGDTLFHGKNYTVKYFKGITSHSRISTSDLKDSSSPFSSRIGLMTNYRFTKHLGVNLDFMGNYTTGTPGWAFLHANVYYAKENFYAKAGKTLDAITMFIPFPITLPAMLAWNGNATLEVNTYTLFTKYNFTDNFGLGFSLGSLGTTINDSIRAAAVVYAYGFSAGVYTTLEKENSWDEGLGFVVKYQSKVDPVSKIYKVAAFGAYKKGLWSGYTEILLNKKHRFYLATDFIYDNTSKFNDDWTREENKFGQGRDYLEVAFLKFYNMKKITKMNVSGMYGLGVTYDKYITVHFGLTF